MDWVAEELANLSFGDKRLNKRAGKILKLLSQNPTDSIPTACRGAAETKAAYRFFDNEQVKPSKIQEIHCDMTLERMSHHPVVLIPQDTTVLSFSGQPMRSDAGPTTKNSTHGMHLHCAVAMTPEKVCLGVVSSKQWHREELQKLTRKERTRKDYAIPIEEKESYRWLENYKKANEYAQKLPTTQIVSMADREGDIYEIYEEAMQAVSKSEVKAHFIIRAKHDRRLCTEEGKRRADKIKATLKNEKSLGEITLKVSETKKRKARTAHLNVYS